MGIAGLAERHRFGLCPNSATTYDRHGNRIDSVWSAVELANRRIVQHEPMQINDELAVS